MRVLASFAIKGGVGKTAAAVNLAWEAAQEGCRTLVWDIDPQGAASFYFRVRPRLRKAKKLLADSRKLAEAIRATDWEGLDLLPADLALRNMDLILDAGGKPKKRLRRLLEPFADEYDLVVIDCPPGLSLSAEAVFRAADALLVPVIPTPLSVRGYEQLRDFRGDGGPRLLPFLSMVDRRRRLHREEAERLPARYPEFLGATIPYAAAVERMGTERLPLGAMAMAGIPGAAAARAAYARLWAEVREAAELVPGVAATSSS